MTETRDWQQMKAQWARILEKSTGEGVEAWNRRIRQRGIADEKSLRDWLDAQGVTGYAQSLLVMEQFGYPDFFVATAEELIDAQYADRPHLRPIYEAIIDAAMQLGEVVIQVRKTYVSLLTPRRTFARVQASTKKRVDLGLRLEGYKAEGRLVPSKIHDTMPLQISLTALSEVDAELREWLKRAYDQNC